MSAFRFDRRVEFAETDAAGIAHFSALIVYMEQAEHAFLRSLGLSVFPQSHTSAESPSKLNVTWPRVHFAADFFGPAHFEELLGVTVQVKRLGESSITYGFEISGPHGLIAKGTSICVCCLHEPVAFIEPGTQRKLQKQRIPEEIRSLLSPFVTA